MKLIQREYQAGDEIYINKLYKLVSDIDRNVQEHEWEWCKTWDGQGSIWLAFDEDREKDDRLIMQYSLIPTPFSFWGNSYLAGKTENCMCHRDYRGKGLYFPHERKYFEEAKKRFQLFFTTAGNATKGAPGAVRRKLGYVALDAWTQYVFCLSPNYLMKLVKSKLKQRGKIFSYLAKILFTIIAHLSSLYFRFHLPPKRSTDIRIFNKHEVPLKEIENFWNRNRKHYMITVDRQSAYLDWRIKQNPYYEYQYLLYYKENHLAGYAIFLLNNDNACVITDIIVENKDMAIFDTIISYLIYYAKEMGADAVLCSTLAGNTILKAAFTKNKFIDLGTFRSIFEHNANQNAFHVYVTSDIKYEQNPLDPRNWYVTDLVKEGRTR